MDRVFNIVKNGNVAEIEIKGDIGANYWWDEEGDAGNTKELMRKEIEALKNIEAESILLKIDSYGGSVHHGSAMLSALKDTGKIIDVEYIGYSASAATFFGTIARNVTIPENLMLLFHQAQTVAMGTADEIESTAKELKIINNMLLDGYVSQSAKAGKNKTREELELLISRANGQGEWIEPKEALEYGLVTNVKKVYAAVANAKRPTKEILNKFGLPEFTNNNNSQTNTKTMGIFSKEKSLNSVKIGEVNAVYEGKLAQDTELVALNGAEIKNGDYEVEGYSVTIEDSKVTSYAKIKETKEAVNLSDFKAEVDSLKTQNDELKAEVAKSNEAVLNMTAAFDKVNATLESLKLTKSEVKPPKADFSNEHEKVEMTDGERLFKLQQERDAKAAQVMNQKSNF